MKPSLSFQLTTLALLLASLACNIPSSTPATPTPTQTPTATLAPTDIPVAPPATPGIEAPTDIPPTSTPEPLPPPDQPAGFYVVSPESGTVVLYDQNNQVISQLSAPGLYGDNPSYAHLSGHLTDGAQDLSLLFFTWESRTLNITSMDGVTTLVSVPDFYMLAGIPTNTNIVYVNLEYADAGLRSSLIVGDQATLPSASPIMTISDSESNAVRPLAFAAETGRPLGVYYTFVKYGIGGDIVFEPRQSLNYLDLDSLLSRQVLNIATSPAGLSPDLTWLAYTPLHNGALTIAPVANLSSPITLPLLPDSDRGAGAAVFSPDNQLVAWKEGSGWMMSETPDFHATIRIATTTGAISAQIPDSAISALIGNPASIWVEPVGWLDNGTLLIEARGDDWEQASILRVSPDGTGLAYLVPGGFMGFIYP